MKTRCPLVFIYTALLLTLGINAEIVQAQVTVSHSQVSPANLAMNPLMEAWLKAAKAESSPLRWQRGGNDEAIGALMFELVDLAPMSRPPQPAELAPYMHQFAGDMMKTPVLLRVGWRGDKSVFLAVNKRPDAPLSPRAQAFIRFALSSAGQAVVTQQAGFRALSPNEVAVEAPKLAAYLATLDPAIPTYAAKTQVQGDVRSVGSDGMKSLMERWMNDLGRAHPGIRRGQRWEHLGTLNGFHALMAGETDLAPMGRELWPDEVASYASLHGGVKPFEIRVARGGFNTQQRTTAQAIFVNAVNPIQSLTMGQLAAIFGRSPTITRWGQLGLTGEWADQPITLDVPPLVAPNAMSVQTMVLRGGAWGESVHSGTVTETTKAIAADSTALGFGGFEDGGPGLKSLAISPDESSPPVVATGETVANGQYPLTRYMYIRMSRQLGQPLPAPVKEFLRYVLSAQGQEPVLYSGYFPLNAKEVAEELIKLD